MPMDDLLNRLMTCLHRQYDLYRELLEQFARERQAVLKSDLVGLQEVIGIKERLLLDIRRVELERHGILEDLGQILAMDCETLTLSRLAQVSDEPFASRLAQFGPEFQGLVQTIQEESSRNRSLCLQALQFVNGSIKLLSSLVSAGPVYRRTGKVRMEGQVGRMLSGAV
jgi:flagellar biosynthesis/type III secretory pathway chaperone